MNYLRENMKIETNLGLRKLENKPNIKYTFGNRVNFTLQGRTTR